MAKFIKEVHDLVNFLAGKNIATKQPPERIDLAIYEVITELFNTYYDNYVKTQKIDDYLTPFKRKATIAVTAGIGQLPLDYKHKRTVTTAADKEVDVVPDKFWNNRKNSAVTPPTTLAPICRLEMAVPESGEPTRTIEVYPSVNVIVHYFKEPRVPKYAYTKVGDRYVYDEANSVDIEFPRGLFNDIKKRVCSSMGINIRDRDLVNYSEQARITDQVK